MMHMCLTLYFMCCSHIKGRVFAALANGSVAVFSRSAGVLSSLLLPGSLHVVIVISKQIY